MAARWYGALGNDLLEPACRIEPSIRDAPAALEAKDGKGVIRAQGGLDKSDVTAAVLDIMEGTEEAFRRRREKYHF